MNSNNSELSNSESSKEDSKDTKENNSDLNNIPSATTPDIPSFGWSAYAERVNGRFAMVGFIAIVLIEAFSKTSFLNWAGLLR